MSSPPADPSGERGLGFKAWAQPIAEWAFWILLALIAYSQTANFADDIADYAFGASGWPRTLCFAIMLGATGQLAYQALTMMRSSGAASSVTDEPGLGDEKRLNVWSSIQRVGVFVLPLIYLYVMPDIGFYVATPFFILGILLLLEVRSPLALTVVTSIVYGLLLLIFTRLFYVALPVGNVQSFYDLNNAIIEIVRTGL